MLDKNVTDGQDFSKQPLRKLTQQDTSEVANVYFYMFNFLLISFGKKVLLQT